MAVWIHVGNNEDVQTLRRMSGLVTPMALRVAVTLGLPDRLRGEAATPGTLATELDVHPTALELLLGHLVTLGVVDRTGAGYRTTEFGANLCADAGNGLHNFLHHDSAAGRAHSIRTGEAAYPLRYGRDFWADLAAQPHLRAAFDRQTTWRIREQVPQFVAAVDWARFATVVDVGGGPGDLLAAVLEAHPAGCTATSSAWTSGPRCASSASWASARGRLSAVQRPPQLGRRAGPPHPGPLRRGHARASAAARRRVHPGRGAGTEMDLIMLVHVGG